MKKTGHALPFAHTVLYSVAFTTICWLIAAFVTPPTSRERLIAFYQESAPVGSRLERRSAKRRASARPRPRATAIDMGKATLGWISGCVTIWSSLFAIGNFLYGRYQLALVLLAIFLVSGVVLINVINRLWDRAPDVQ